MDVVQEFEQLSPRILDYVNRGRQVTDQLEQLNLNIYEVSQIIGQYVDNIDTHTKALTVFQNLIQRMSESHIKRVQDLVTQGLQTVFYDRHYALEVEVSNRGNNKQAEMFLVEVIDNPVEPTIVKSPLRDGIGGGVLAFIGFVFQVFYIEHLGASHTLFLDESFSQLSSQYIDGLVSFLKTLSEKRGFKIVLISHDPRLIPYADQVVEVEKGVYKTDERNLY